MTDIFDGVEFLLDNTSSASMETTALDYTRQVSISHWGPVTISWDEYDALWRAATESGNWGYDDFDPEWDKSPLPSSRFKNDLAFTGEPKFEPKCIEGVA